MIESIIVVLGIVFDQLTKVWSELVLAMMPNATIPVIPGVFELTYVQNRGAAFGMLQGYKGLFVVLTLVTVGILLFMLIRYRKTYSLLMRICIAMVLSGAIGNFIDRLFLSYVRDMFYFKLINFAVFNVADALISVGAVGLVICILVMDSKKAKQEKLDAKSQEANHNKAAAAAIIQAGGMEDDRDYAEPTDDAAQDAGGSGAGDADGE